MTPFREETISEARLIMADCRDVLPTLGSVDVLVTDPPYGVDFKGKATKHTQASKDFSGGYLSGDTDIGPEIVRLALALVQRGVVFPGARMMFDYPKPYEIGSVYCPSGAGLGRWGFTVFHPMLFYGMGLPHTRQGPSGFASFDTVEDCGHPCPKPLRWMLWAVNKCSLPGQAVLDPFMGSGTTGMACARLGRAFIGIEKEQSYFDIACRRVEQTYRQRDLFIEPSATAKAKQEAML